MRLADVLLTFARGVVPLLASSDVRRAGSRLSLEYVREQESWSHGMYSGWPVSTTASLQRELISGADPAREAQIDELSDCRRRG